MDQSGNGNGSGSSSFFSAPDFLKQHRIREQTWDPDMEGATRVAEPTDFGKMVVDALAAMTKNQGVIDQRILRMYLALAASHLVMDSTMNTEGGIASWNTGFHRLVDVCVALNNRGELELDTVNEAAKACSECWSTSGAWRGLEQCRDAVREIAEKLKSLLDPNGRTFHGEPIYTP